MDAARYALLLAYDGARFHGWARQRARRTVQETLEDALTMLLREQIRLTCAGRTDSGVHAAGQVVSFDSAPGTEPAWLTRRVNRLLAPEISIRQVAVVPAAFDARFSAARRIYEYRIYDGVAPDPFLDRFALWEPLPLDVEAMNRAVQCVVGAHDFTSFCRDNGKTLIRRIRTASVSQSEPGRTTIRFEGDSFCHQMVRSIAGCLMAVGLGRRPVEWMEEALAAKDRHTRVSLAPARGLTLMAVEYDPNPFQG